MTRRELLSGAAGLALAGRLSAEKGGPGKSRIGKDKISAITDEIGVTQADAIKFAHQYGLQWVELRGVPETKKAFASLPEAELKAHAALLAENKLKVSFLNTGLLKFTWPGTVNPRQKPETDDAKAKRLARDQSRWDRRKEDMANALMAANILGVDKVRVFTGTRVEDPASTYPRIVQVMNELVPLAEKANVRLLIENENSQNIGTSSELAAIMERLPSKWIGYNWDPQNALPLGEVPFPDGYSKLPKDRMLNAQFKGKGLLPGAERIPWLDILRAMQNDGYQGKIGLETHYFDGTLIEKAHLSMQEIMRMIGELS